MGVVIVASDGSGIKKEGLDTPAWWCSGGYVAKVLGDSKDVIETFSDGVKLDNSTNNIGELTGLEMAIDAMYVLSEKNTIIFLLDSEYTLKAVTTWIKAWVQNMRDGVAYTKGGKNPVKNFEQIFRIVEKLKKIKHKKILKIRSHVPVKDYKRRYHEFCAINKIEVTYEMWLFMNQLNNECDELVFRLSNELRLGK